MHEFAEDYVAGLKPRQERYDSRLGDDFYVATFPNGVKTWQHVYQVNGHTRRRTLGVYPEMPLDRALEALFEARRALEVERELAEQGVDGSTLQREGGAAQPTAQPRQPFLSARVPERRFLAGAAVGGSVSLVVVGLVALVLRIPVELPEVVYPPLREGLGAAAAADEAGAPVPAAAMPPAPAPDTAGQDAVPPAARTAAAPSPAAGGDGEAQALSDTEQALIELQRDLAGTVAWAQLTNDVVDGEPVDDIGWLVELEDREPRRVYYFIRVRGLAGKKVLYRWTHEGETVKEDAVELGEGWHSPAYSGVVITTERLGRWRVAVYDHAGRQLGAEDFEARLGSTRVSRAAGAGPGML